MTRSFCVSFISAPNFGTEKVQREESYLSLFFGLACVFSKSLQFLTKTSGNGCTNNHVQECYDFFLSSKII